jgi:excinuclease UvrABC helicase subunit UvrB
LITGNGNPYISISREQALTQIDNLQKKIAKAAEDENYAEAARLKEELEGIKKLI